MPINIIESKVCRTLEGVSTLWDKLENTDVQVITKPEWDANTLVERTNNSGHVNAALQPIEDANGKYILSKSVLTAGDWGGANVPLAAYVALVAAYIEINHVYWVQQLDAQGNPISCPPV